MVVLHRVDEERPGQAICWRVCAHDALAFASQLCRCGSMNVHPKTLAEATDARSIGSVYPDGSPLWVRVNLKVRCVVCHVIHFG